MPGNYASGSLPLGKLFHPFAGVRVADLTRGYWPLRAEIQLCASPLHPFHTYSSECRWIYFDDAQMERGTITLRASVPTSSFAEVVLASKERAADSGLMGENAEQRSLLDAPSSSFLSSRSSLTATSSSGNTRDRNTYSVSSPSLVEFQRTCKAGNEEEVPKLKTLEQWISSKARPRESVTLLTQLSADRMPMLENQCRIWPDPVIAVMFVAIKHNEYDDSSPILVDYPDTTLEDVKRGISSFHAFMETTATCALRIELVGQYVDASNGRTFEYPINSLRNRALDLADTDLVLVLDVDFVASPMLGLPEPGYRDPAVYNQMVDITSRKKAIVLPAFEITNRRQDLVMAQNFARSLVVGKWREILVGRHLTIIILWRFSGWPALSSEG